MRPQPGVDPAQHWHDIAVTANKEAGDLAEAVCRLGLDFTNKTQECDDLRQEVIALRRRVAEQQLGYIEMLQQARKSASDAIEDVLKWQRKSYEAEDRARELERELAKARS
jgi:hypothetical protein